MSPRLSLTLVLTLGAAAGAAEPIKIDLGDFKLTSAVKGRDDLVKYENDTISFYVNGAAAATLKVPADGDYTVVLDLSCVAALKEHAKVTLKIGDTVVKDKFELTTEDQKEYKFEAKLKKGETTLTITYVNDTYKENEYDRNLFVHGVKLEKK